jgi:hypothetical protein
MCYDVHVMNQEYKPYILTAIIGVGITTLLTSIVILLYWNASKNAPVPSGDLLTKPTSQSVGNNPNEFSVAPDTEWETVKGNIYPYSFSAPVTLALTTFAGDPYDMYAISWKGQPTDQNVLMGVDNLKNDPSRTHFISEPKINYVREWYKQFGLKGVSSIEQFTNKKGMIGYKAKYFNTGGVSPNTDVFFEVAGHPEYMIHFSSGILAPDVFTKIIDSVDWEKK